MLPLFPQVAPAWYRVCGKFDYKKEVEEYDMVVSGGWLVDGGGCAGASAHPCVALAWGPTAAFKYCCSMGWVCLNACLNRGRGRKPRWQAWQMPAPTRAAHPHPSRLHLFQRPRHQCRGIDGKGKCGFEADEEKDN